MSDYETLSGDDLNRAIAECLRWFEHSPGKWLKPVDKNITPQLIFVPLTNWAQTPGLALQDIVNDGFLFSITHRHAGSLALRLENGDSWMFESDSAWYDLNLKLIREWLKWKNL